MPGTQHDALCFMAQQLLDHLDGPHRGPLLLHEAAMSVRDTAWQAQRELIQEEVHRIANPIRERISDMALSEIVDQLEAGDSIHEITRVLELEVEEKAWGKFADRLAKIKVDTTAWLKEEARLEAEEEAETMKAMWNLEFRMKNHEVAEAKAWNEQYEHFSTAYTKDPMVIAKAKLSAKKTADREYVDALDECCAANKLMIDQELRPEIELYKSQKWGQLMLQADQSVAIEECNIVYTAAVRLGLINPSESTSLPPVPKQSRQECYVTAGTFTRRGFSLNWSVTKQ
jgi:hypothetical protein